uniref:Uncharacterized protein n=1 Tax=Oryza sativa subsp. japonica TaxID=39947 RepID=Q6EPC6_ORYSJ|nr:hypothetical protein [Oryza sativa Japonica Group]BAD29494.1 hypothetical protein [Oryza sativa Japonica Group]
MVHWAQCKFASPLLSEPCGYMICITSGISTPKPNCQQAQDKLFILIRSFKPKACSNRMASKVTETAPGALSNGLWLAWAECAQTNQPMCVFGVAQGPARLLGFSSLYSTTHCKQRGARSLLPPRMTPPDE